MIIQFDAALYAATLGGAAASVSSSEAASLGGYATSNR